MVSKEQYEIALGKRWYPLYMNPGAVNLDRDRYIIKRGVIPAGRRSGKTERSKRHFIELGLTRLADKSFKHDDQNYFLAAPTRDQAKTKIFWPDLKKFLRIIPKQYKDISETELRLEVRHPLNEDRNVVWWVLGLDKPERMEALDWDGGLVDEFGNTKADTYSEHIHPALDTPGRDPIFWAIGVPEGRNHYYELAMHIKNKALEDNTYGYYTWFSSEVLSPKTIEIAKEFLDPKSFAQEYEASWETKSGLVYYAWTAQRYPNGNIDNSIQYDNQLPVYIGMDFNVDPMAAILAHHIVNKDKKMETLIFDAFFLRNSNTKQLTERILLKYPDAPSYVLTPCHSADKRQTSQSYGKTDIKIIEDIFRTHKKILRIARKSKNPFISDRHNVVNSRLYHNLLRINCEKPGCKDLIKDFEALSYKEGTSDVDETDKMRNHISAALGYSEDYHFDIKAMIHSDDKGKGFIP